MPKVKNGNTQADFEKGLAIVNGDVFKKAMSISKKFGLKLRHDKKLDQDGGWSTLLSLTFTKENSDFRVGWDCRLSSDFQKEGTVGLWDIVTNPDTCKWIQNGKDKVKLEDLKVEALKSLSLFEKNVEKLFKFTPKEMTKKSTGLQCDWDHKQDKYGESVWTTDFGTNNILARVDSGCSVELEVDGVAIDYEFNQTSLDTMLALEFEYFKKPMIQKKMKETFKT